MAVLHAVMAVLSCYPRVAVSGHLCRSSFCQATGLCISTLCDLAAELSALGLHIG